MFPYFLARSILFVWLLRYCYFKTTDFCKSSRCGCGIKFRTTYQTVEILSFFFIKICCNVRLHNIYAPHAILILHIRRHCVHMISLFILYELCVWCALCVHHWRIEKYGERTRTYQLQSNNSFSAHMHTHTRRNWLTKVFVRHNLLKDYKQIKTSNMYYL